MRDEELRVRRPVYRTSFPALLEHTQYPLPDGILDAHGYREQLEEIICANDCALAEFEAVIAPYRPGGRS